MEKLTLGPRIITKRVKIGNENYISCFKDPWIPREITFKPIYINLESFNDRVANFIIPSGQWDIRKLGDSVLDIDLEVIKRIPINRELEVKIIWHYDKTGKYTVKSGYRLFMNGKINEASSSSNPMGNVWKNLWKLDS